MSRDFWNNHQPQGDFPPSFPPANSGGWQPGQAIEGVITALRQYTFENDDHATPIVHLRTDDGQEWSVACGAVRLMSIMYSLAPSVGERIRITCTGLEGKSKAFTVDRLGAPGQAPAPTAAPPQPQPQPQPQAYQPPAAPAPAQPPAPAYTPPPAPAQPEQQYQPPAPAPAPAAPAPAPQAPPPVSY